MTEYETIKALLSKKPAISTERSRQFLPSGKTFQANFAHEIHNWSEDKTGLSNACTNRPEEIRARLEEGIFVDRCEPLGPIEGQDRRSHLPILMSVYISAKAGFQNGRVRNLKIFNRRGTAIYIANRMGY